MIDWIYQPFLLLIFISIKHWLIDHVIIGLDAPRWRQRGARSFLDNGYLQLIWIQSLFVPILGFFYIDLYPHTIWIGVFDATICSIYYLGRQIVGNKWWATARQYYSILFSLDILRFLLTALLIFFVYKTASRGAFDIGVSHIIHWLVSITSATSNVIIKSIITPLVAFVAMGMVWRIGSIKGLNSCKFSLPEFFIYFFTVYVILASVVSTFHLDLLLGSFLTSSNFYIGRILLAQAKYVNAKMVGVIWCITKVFTLLNFIALMLFIHQVS